MPVRLGIIAGKGKFPLLIAEEARKRGYTTLVVAHTGLTSGEIEGIADRVHWIKIGEMNRLIKILQEEGVTEAVMAGGVSKRFMFQDVEPDSRALSLLFRIEDRKDDTILRAVAEELEREGISIHGATEYVQSILADRGVLTKTGPGDEEWRDIEFGMEMARNIGRLDIGQCVVVKDRAVLAVEAIEGTDEAILRGGRLAGSGAVVAKCCKPGQDIRFDLPTVGPGTIDAMRGVSARVLAIEAGMTIMIDRESMIESANRAGISIVGI